MSMKPLLVFLRFRLVDAASFTMRRLAMSRPLKGLMRAVVSASFPWLIEFFADTDRSCALTLKALPYAMSAFATAAVIPMSLNFLVESLRDVLSSGARVISRPFMFTSRESSGILIVTSSLMTFPLMSALEKLYMFSCDISALP